MTSTPIDIEKMRSIGVISKRTKPKVVEGKHHPDSGLRYKAVTNEENHTVTEHSANGATGTSIRQDVHLRPKIVEG